LFQAIYLVQGIVQALVDVVKVAEDDRLPRLHGDLDLVDVPADLVVLLVFGKSRPEDDLGRSGVDQALRVYFDSLGQV